MVVRFQHTWPYLPAFAVSHACFPHPTMSRRAADSAAGRKGWRSQTKGGKQEANGGKLAFIRAVQAFTCPAEWPGPLPVFIQLTFTSQTGSLLLSSLKKVTFPPSSLSPPSVTSSPAPDRPRCSAGTHPPACPRRGSGASGAFAARIAG